MKFYQSLNQTPRSPKHGKHRRASPPAHGRTIVGADYGSGGSDQSVTVTWIGPSAWNYLEPKPAPPAIPYAGIRTGEIIGHRLWRLLLKENGEWWLYSLAHDRRWLPGETIEGDINEHLGTTLWGSIWGGVYAFSEFGTPLASEIILMETREREWAAAINKSPEPFVRGTIKMWGEVVEHETGYRAQFAKLHTLDELYGPGDIETLRKKYLPTQTEQLP